jgi:hypothetical protein
VKIGLSVPAFWKLSPSPTPDDTHTETVSKTIDTTVTSTWLIIKEYFIAFSHHENFKLYKN